MSQPVVEGWIRTSLVDYPGGICSCVFLAGCNLRCIYCHNPELVLGGPGLECHPWDELLRYLERRKRLIDAVCFSGGEPTLREELPEMLRSVKALGLKTKLDTNGTRPDMLHRLVRDGLVDYIAMDVKAPPEKYSTVCGCTVDIQAVEQSVQLIRESGVQYEFRTTAHPALLTERDFLRICAWINGAARYVIQACRTGVCLDPEFQMLPPAEPQWLESVSKLCIPHFGHVVLRNAHSARL